MLMSRWARPCQAVVIASGAHSLTGILRRDAVAQPVRAGRRARLVSERVGQALSVRGLSIGLRLVAVSDMLGQVLGQVADAPRRVA
jgi:hypothetical protein